MEMSPKNINKEHVLAAVARIEKENIELIPATKWAVEINGKQYPPKEIMRYAHQEMNGKKIWNYSGGSSTNDFLTSMGFKIIKLNNDPIQDMVAEYKEYIKRGGLKNELYKWKLLGEFKGRPNINASDFYEELNSINFANLIYPMAKAVMNRIAKKEPERYKKCFQVLYDENTELSKRIKWFSKEVASIYRDIEPDKKLQDHHDERTISTLLTFHNPDKYCFYKNSFYQKYCKLLGVKPKDKGQKFVHYLTLIEDFVLEYIVNDAELISLVNNNLKKEYFDDNSHKILAQDILYQSLDVGIDNKKKYWLFAPGERAKMWDKFYANNIMALGGIELGDIKKYKSKEEIAKKMQEIENTTSSKKNDAKADYDLANNISIGDIIIAKKGQTEYVGYGFVISDYYFDPTEVNYPHIRKVKWIKRGSWIEEHGIIVQKSLTDITQDIEKVRRLSKLIGIEDQADNRETKNINKLSIPLNTILYGPPGTGKTYQLKNRYFKYFTDNQVTQTKEEYNVELIKDLSWWEVISISLLDNNKIKVFDILNHPLVHAKVSVSSGKTPRNTIWATLQERTKEECKNVNNKYRYSPQLFWKDDEGYWSVDEEIVKTETPEFIDVLEKYRNWKPETTTKKRYVFTTFHQSFSYEDFIEGIKPKVVNEEGLEETKQIVYEIKPGLFKEIVHKAENDPENEYAIFIDEINRGNIANIFGELITLIETDKRKECKNALSATLPYSGEEFSVPKNLYIIATMNTADRSVEVLDTALRRRFSFLEINPKPELLAEPEYQCKGIDLETLLTTINARIEKLMDKDYCIGHSYFMTIDDRQNPLKELRYIFTNKIIPLLQEYFYGDWGKIMLVLGKGFVKKVVKNVEFLANDDYEDYEMYQDKPVYRFTDPNYWDINTFIEIYEK